MRRATSESTKRPPTCSTTCSCCCAAAGALLRDAERVLDGRRCLARSHPTRAASARCPSTPTLEDARALAARLQPDPAHGELRRGLRDARLGVPEDPRARPLGPGLPARVRRAGPARRALVLHRLPAARTCCAGRSATAATPTRSRARPSRACTRRRSAGRAARSRAAPWACSATTWCAPSSRSANRTRTRSGVPDLALMLTDGLLVFDHLRHTIDDPRRTPTSTREPDVDRAYADAVAAIAESARRWPARCRASSPEPAREVPEFRSNMPREQFEAMVARIIALHPRRGRLPGRALPALVGAEPGRGVLDLPRPARRQPESVHVLPGLRRLPGRGREPRAAAHGQRAARHDQADRRHAAARRQRRGGPPDRRAS